METLVRPLKTGNAALLTAFEHALMSTDMRLLPITRTILREAARLRATVKLKTPDAIHAAAARHSGCVLFVTNDQDYRGIAGLPVIILDDLLTP